MSGNLNAFNKSSFAIYGDRKLLNTTKQTKQTGEFYPLRDSCDLSGDDQRCTQAQELYYSTYINHYSSKLMLKIMNDGHEVVNRTIPTKLTTTLRPQDLNCTGDVYSFPWRRSILFSDLCSLFCENRKGTWDVQYNVCYLRQYLYSVCFRLQDYLYYGIPFFPAFISRQSKGDSFRLLATGSSSVRGRPPSHL